MPEFSNPVTKCDIYIVIDRDREIFIINSKHFELLNVEIMC